MMVLVSTKMELAANPANARTYYVGLTERKLLLSAFINTSVICEKSECVLLVSR